MNGSKRIVAAFAALAVTALSAATVEISVDLRLDQSDYVAGERIRGIVDVANSSPDKVSVGYSNSKDLLFVEVFKSGTADQL